MRENRTYGSEGGEDRRPSLPLSIFCRPRNLMGRSKVVRELKLQRWRGPRHCLALNAAPVIEFASWSPRTRYGSSHAALTTGVQYPLPITTNFPRQ